MDSPSSFEHQQIESDMKTIAKEVNYGEIQGEQEKTREGIEAVKNAIRAFPTFNRNEQASVNIPTPVPPATPPANNSDDSRLPAYTQTAPPEVKKEIEYLVDLAMQKGVTEALTQSEKSPYFVQDAFHDALAGKLYPELQKRGLIK